MADDVNVGDHVEWNSEAGRVRGTIKKKHTSEITFKGYTVHASSEDAYSDDAPVAFSGRPRRNRQCGSSGQGACRRAR
jgi:hypothetical protein